jgi:hypothetical protein
MERHMKNTVICTIGALAVAGAVSLSASSAMAAGSDAFNRTLLGAGWVVASGSLSISNHGMVGSSESLGALTKSSKDSAASAVMYTGGTDLEYGAVALGNIGGANNAFVKLQAQNGNGEFDHAGFYNGNNSGSDFFALTSAVPSPATVDVFFCGTTATMRITSAAGVQTYTDNYGTTYGKGGGLGTYGSIRLDNYVGFKSGCSDVEEGAIPASSMRHDKDLSLSK